MRSLYIDSTLNNYFQPLLSKYKIHRAHRSSKCCTGCKASGTARPANKSSCRAGGCRAGCMPADKWSTPARGSAAGPKGSGTRNCRAPCPQRCGLRSGRGCCYPGRNLPARHNNASGRPGQRGNAFQNIHRFCIVPVADIVVGGLHLRRFPAVIAAAGPAIGAAKAKGVKPEPKAKRILVLLLAAAAAALPIIAGRAAAGCTGPPERIRMTSL